MIYHIVWSTLSREADWVIGSETWPFSMWSTLQCQRYLYARGWMRCWENCLDWRELFEEPDIGCIIIFTFLFNCFFHAQRRWGNGLAVACNCLVLYNLITLSFCNPSGMQGSVWFDLCGTKHMKLHMIILLCFSTLLFETVTHSDNLKLLRLYFHNEEHHV